MKRKQIFGIITGILLAVISFTVIANNQKIKSEKIPETDTYTAEVYDVEISLEKNIVDYDLPVVTINGHTYVPLRETAEKSGFDVIWNEGDKDSINIKYNTDKFGKCMIKNTIGIDFPDCAKLVEFEPDIELNDVMYMAKIEVDEKDFPAVKDILDEKMYLKEKYDEQTLFIMNNHLYYNNAECSWWELSAYNEDVLVYTTAHSGNLFKTIFARAFVTKKDTTYIIYFEHDLVGF